MTDVNAWSHKMAKQKNVLLSENQPLYANVYEYLQRHAQPVVDMHFELELGIVLEGRVRRYFGNAQTNRSAGDVWFCGMWEPHGFRVVEAPYRVVVFNIWPPLLSKVFFIEGLNIN